MGSHQKFWIIWAIWPPHSWRPSRIRHPTFAEAEKEAQKLAKKYRGRRFQILEAVGAVLVGEEDTTLQQTRALRKYQAAERAELDRLGATRSDTNGFDVGGK